MRLDYELVKIFDNGDKLFKNKNGFIYVKKVN